MKFKKGCSCYHSRVDLPKVLFDQLNPAYFISGCTDTIKYMCANDRETMHLELLGVDFEEDYCHDWFEIHLEEEV